MKEKGNKQLSLNDLQLDFDAEYTRDEMLFRLDALDTFLQIRNDQAAQRCLKKIREVAEPAAVNDIIHFELDEETDTLYPIATKGLPFRA